MADPGYTARLAEYRKTIHRRRAVVDADEVRKLLASIEQEGSPRTEECRGYRAHVLARLRSIVEGDGYPRAALEDDSVPDDADLGIYTGRPLTAEAVFDD
jgi:recombinational DNA repair ATPase RecF